MKMNTIKKLGRASLLAAVFAASAMPALAQQAPGRGPNGDKQYSTLTREIDGLGDINAEINRTIRTAQINHEALDQDAIKSLRSSLKDGVDVTAPKIILASDISAQDVQMLLDQFKQKAGALPDYLAKVNGKAKLVRVCQEYLVTPDGAVDKEHAVEIANCVASKKVVDSTPVAPVQAQPVTPQPVTPPPVEQTAPVQTAPVNTAPVNTTEPAKNSSSNLPLEIGGGAGALVVVGGGIFLLARKKKKPEPEAAPEKAAASAPPPQDPPPAPPKDENKIDVFKKPLQVTPPPPPTQPDDTGPAKKAKKFEI